MSNQSGRSWYRFSSVVRQTQHSSRDPSPPLHVIKPPRSPVAPPSPPPPPQLLTTPLRPPPKQVQEAKPSPVTSSRSIKHEPAKPRHEEENKEQQHESDDVTMGTQGVITISGENKGAVMEIQRSPSKTQGIKKENRSNNSKKHNDNSGGHLPMDGFVNSNVQIVNGSVVYNSSETHHDPGVHLSLYWKRSPGNGFIVKDHGNGYNSSIN
ncbi:hypothetical protein N665_0108s0033 [Sinapis alba]|nr:hypothetical protein N665_0108s0033 [Sinapis alba]